MEPIINNPDFLVANSDPQYQAVLKWALKMLRHREEKRGSRLPNDLGAVDKALTSLDELVSVKRRLS